MAQIFCDLGSPVIVADALDAAIKHAFAVRPVDSVSVAAAGTVSLIIGKNITIMVCSSLSALHICTLVLNFSWQDAKA